MLKRIILMLENVTKWWYKIRNEKKEIKSNDIHSLPMRFFRVIKKVMKVIYTIIVLTLFVYLQMLLVYIAAFENRTEHWFVTGGFVLFILALLSILYLHFENALIQVVNEESFDRQEKIVFRYWGNLLYCYLTIFFIILLEIGYSKDFMDQEFYVDLGTIVFFSLALLVFIYGIFEHNLKEKRKFNGVVVRREILAYIAYFFVIYTLIFGVFYMLFILYAIKWIVPLFNEPAIYSTLELVFTETQLKNIITSLPIVLSLLNSFCHRAVLILTYWLVFLPAFAFWFVKNWG